MQRGDGRQYGNDAIPNGSVSLASGGIAAVAEAARERLCTVTSRKLFGDVVRDMVSCSSPRAEQSICNARHPTPADQRRAAVRYELVECQRMGVRVGNITVDCDDVLRVARFWSEALERPLDDGASQWGATIGRKDPARVEPAWLFQQVAEPKTAKNRMHVDVFDLSPGIVERLVGLGATVVARHDLEWANHGWTVMRDPEGNEFCVGAKPFTGV